jgi:hypothetical protein
MRLLVRILNCCVLLLAAIYGLLILYAVATQEPLESDVPPQQVAQEERLNPLEWLRSHVSLPSFLRREIPLVVVMIENQEHARPHQQGLSDALLVEEWPVEGFITRFAVVFNGNDLPKKAGPVRSIRPYFIHSLAPWPVLLLHAGGSPEAFEAVNASATIEAANGIGGTYYEFFHREDGIPAPHDLFIDRANMQHIALEHDMDTMRWPPYNTGIAAKGEPVSQISVNFYNPDHDTSYEYDPRTQRYIRTNGDVENQASPANVLFLEIPVTGIGEFGRLQIPVRGDGALLLFRNGMLAQGTWEKANDTEAFHFLAQDGSPLNLARGQTWMTVLPSFDRITWGNGTEDTPQE